MLWFGYKLDIGIYNWNEDITLTCVTGRNTVIKNFYGVVTNFVLYVLFKVPIAI